MTNTTSTINTREQFISLFASTQAAVAFENEILQSGREFLPAQAILVRNGAEPTAEYWRWLAGQFDGMKTDNNEFCPLCGQTPCGHPAGYSCEGRV